MMMLVSMLLFQTIFPLIQHAWVNAQSTSSEISYHMDYNQTGNLINDTDYSISCVSCYVVGDLSLSGGTSSSPPDSNFSGLPFDFTKDWAGAVVEDFKAHVEVNVLLTPTGPTNEVTIPLLGQDGLHFDEKIGFLLGIDWQFDPVLHGWVNSSTPVNFTYGFEFVVPNNSAVYIPIGNLSNITSVGFPQSKLTPLNYTSPDANDSFAFELAFRPIFKASVSVAEMDTPLSAAVFADVPRLDVAVSQVPNVTHDCRPATPDTPAEQVFRNLTYVVPTLGFDFAFNATGVSSPLMQIGSNTSLPDTCLQYAPDIGALQPPRESPKSAPKASTGNSSNSEGSNGGSSAGSSDGSSDGEASSGGSSKFTNTPLMALPIMIGVAVSFI